MKSMKKAIALAIVSLAAAASQAATQGNASTTSSVATFTNSFGTQVVLPTIRVFGLQDAALPAGDNSTTDSFYNIGTGKGDSFCVAHSTGGAVRLSFSNAGGGDSGSLLAVDAATGATVGYHLSVGVGSGPWALIGSNAGTTSVNVAAGTTQTDLVACTAPNVRKSMITQGVPAPTSGFFVDTVTVTATPL